MTLPPGVVRTTFCAPADFAGTVTVTEVEVLLDIDVPAVPPKVIELVLERLVPAIVTVFSPEVGPIEGVIEEIVGGGVVKF